MIRDKYAALIPPGPVIHVRVRCPAGGAEADRELALMDSAADCTALPGRLINRLTLESIGQFQIASFAGKVDSYPIYDVEIFVPGRADGFRVKVAAVEDESRIYLGRDVLNRLRVFLDGPGLAVEFE